MPNIASRQRPIRTVSAALGIAGLAFLYEAGEHGGDLVYSYAGGPGLRTGKPEDVGRLLRAGLYEQAQQDRRAGRGADAAVLIAELARRWPDHVTAGLHQVTRDLLWREPHGILFGLCSGCATPVGRSTVKHATPSACVRCQMAWRVRSRPFRVSVRCSASQSNELSR